MEPLHFTHALTIVKPSPLGHDFSSPTIPSVAGARRAVVPCDPFPWLVA